MKKKYFFGNNYKKAVSNKIVRGILRIGDLKITACGKEKG